MAPRRPLHRNTSEIYSAFPKAPRKGETLVFLLFNDASDSKLRPPTALKPVEHLWNVLPITAPPLPGRSRRRSDAAASGGGGEPPRLRDSTDATNEAGLPGRSADLDQLCFLVAGLIKTALPGMDREVKEHYQVVIQAKDMAGQMGGLSGTTTVSIALADVNDNPPRFTKSESRGRASAQLVPGVR